MLSDLTVFSYCCFDESFLFPKLSTSDLQQSVCIAASLMFHFSCSFPSIFPFLLTIISLLRAISVNNESNSQLCPIMGASVCTLGYDCSARLICFLLLCMGVFLFIDLLYNFHHHTQQSICRLMTANKGEKEKKKNV